MKHSRREMKKSIMEMEIAARTATLNEIACYLYTAVDREPSTESDFNQVMAALINANENARGVGVLVYDV